MNQMTKVLIPGLLMLAEVETKHRRCEYVVNPIGIDATHPRLSWILDSARRGEKQTAYQVLVASKPELLKQDTGDVWDSGKVMSDATSQIVYAGKSLGS